MFSVNIREISIVNGDPLLQNVSFLLEPGNVYSIIGKNGSGKTTLLKSLTNLEDKRFFRVEGSVIYKGTNLINLEEERIIPLREKYIKYVFQDPVSSFNPLKKLQYYFDLLKPDQGEIDECLEHFLLPSVKALGRLHSYELSGGMAQRLALAFAIASKPVLLCLDEPNSGTDHAISFLISENLKKFAKGNNSIVLIITQDLSFAEHTSDYCGMISDKTFSGFYRTSDLFSESEKNPGLSNMFSAYKSL